MDDSSNSTAPAINAALIFIGAAVGGAVGYLVFGWLVRQGFYAPAIPGVLLGVGGGLLAKKRSLVVAVACGFLGAALCLFAEWRYFPFVRDDSLSYFLAHFFELKPLTMIMVALGGFAGFWFAWRARPTTPRRQTPPSTL